MVLEGDMCAVMVCSLELGEDELLCKSLGVGAGLLWFWGTLAVFELSFEGAMEGGGVMSFTVTVCRCGAVDRGTHLKWPGERSGLTGPGEVMQRNLDEYLMNALGERDFISFSNGLLLLGSSSFVNTPR